MGWWINPEGKSISTEHFSYIIDHPKTFGYTKAEAKSWGVADRQPTIDSVKSQGWVRVVGTRPHLAVEFWLLTPHTIWQIKEFFKKVKMDPAERVLFEETASTHSWYEPAAWILGDMALAVARNPKGKKRRVR